METNERLIQLHKKQSMKFGGEKQMKSHADLTEDISIKFLEWKETLTKEQQGTRNGFGALLPKSKKELFNDFMKIYKTL